MMVALLLLTFFIHAIIGTIVIYGHAHVRRVFHVFVVRIFKFFVLLLFNGNGNTNMNMNIASSKKIVQQR